MKILRDDEKFQALLAGFVQKDFDPDVFNLLDYHWFLISLLEGLERSSSLEIVKNSDGSFETYRILEGTIQDDNFRKLSLKLEREPDNSIVERSFNILGVEDPKPRGFRKYYIETPDDKYRFVIKFDDTIDEAKFRTFLNLEPQ